MRTKYTLCARIAVVVVAVAVVVVNAVVIKEPLKLSVITDSERNIVIEILLKMIMVVNVAQV